MKKFLTLSGLLICYYAQALPLKEIIHLTIKNSKEIEETNLLIETSKNDLHRAKSVRNPNINAKFFAAPIWKTTGSTEGYENDYSKWGIFSGGEISIVQPLFAWNIEKNLINAASRGVNISRTNADQKKNEILKRVIDLYLNLQLTNKLLDLVNSNNDRLDKVESYLEKHGSSGELLKFKIKRSSIDEKTLLAEMAKNTLKNALLFYTSSTKDSLESDENLEPLSFASEELNYYLTIAKKNNFSLKKLEYGLIAKSEMLEAEKKKKYPVFFASAVTDFKHSNVKERQVGPWRYDPYNGFGFGAFVGLKLNFDTSVSKSNERKALVEQKELLIKKEYAESALSLQIEKIFHEFIYNKKLVEITNRSMRYARQLFIKESLRYDLKKKNGKDLFEALLERILAIKNYYTAVTNVNNKYIELLDACGKDLSDLDIY